MAKAMTLEEFERLRMLQAAWSIPRTNEWDDEIAEALAQRELLLATWKKLRGYLGIVKLSELDFHDAVVLSEEFKDLIARCEATE